MGVSADIARTARHFQGPKLSDNEAFVYDNACTYCVEKRGGSAGHGIYAVIQLASSYGGNKSLF